jgi:sulfide:quinone oxidoreductase
MSRMVESEDGMAVDRWINEGGRWSAQRASRRPQGPGGRAPSPVAATHGRAPSARPRILVAGGGVAGLETLLALRGLLGDRVDVTIVAADHRFVNRSMAIDQPTRPLRVRGLKLKDVVAEFDATWHHGAIARVEHDRHRVRTQSGRELTYDRLVLASGARPSREWHQQDVLTFHGGSDGAEYRVLLRQLLAGRIRRVAFVKPGGCSWPLPLYELALSTAAICAAGAPTAELMLVTPEPEPLSVFGERVSEAVRERLEACGVVLVTSSRGVPSRPGRLHISPTGRRVEVDRIVTLPRLAGPDLPGVPSGPDGFIPTDASGRVIGVEDVYAAGDATDFPIKQGGLAAQQADAVVDAIAASLGMDIAPGPPRRILRGLLSAGGSARYLRADISAGSSDSTVSDSALWWPPNRLCARYLAPYLSSQVGYAADVRCPRQAVDPRGDQARQPETPDTLRHFAELSDL